MDSSFNCSDSLDPKTHNTTSAFKAAIVFSMSVVCLTGVNIMADEPSPTTNMPVSAPIDTDSAAKSGDVALNSVVRIGCPKLNIGGTGFLHKSGRIITAEHVVHGCPEILIQATAGTITKASIVAADSNLDLAVLAPDSPLKTKALVISTRDQLSIGTQVSTWGFPGGYEGLSPILSVGYLSGTDIGRTPAGAIVTRNGRVITQWVVNAAFNRGNSGGPLLHIETGEVIGVVSSKLAPISKLASNALEVLRNQKSGFIYQATDQSGAKIDVSEGQVVGIVLDELRNQVQLVIGKAVLLGDLREFLKEHQIEP